MTLRELREKYLAFFESKGHRRYPSGSLIPFDVTGRLDESLLFNGAGMIQFKPYFRGVAQPEHRRLITCQKCVRTGDIEEVGDLTHLTFFEMLGNFSFGDYFKAEAIAFSWEFLTSPSWLALDPARLSFTVFEDDDEAYGEWSKWISAAGIDPATRVFRLGEDTNYWPAGAFSKGPPGPCGPNSEMFYWVALEEPPSKCAAVSYTREDWVRDEGAGKWLEIWNDVFIQYEWQGHLRNPERPSDGFVKDAMPGLPFRSIDTGMGLDRTAAVLMGGGSVYETDSFAPIFRVIDEIGLGTGLQAMGSTELESVARADQGLQTAEYHGRQSRATSGQGAKARRIIADHIRTAVFCIADGVLPGNSGRGYVLRRLIRRAVLKGQRVLGFEEPFFHRVYEGVVEAMGDFYPEIVERRDVIVETLLNEEEQFRRTLHAGHIHLQHRINSILDSLLEPVARIAQSDQGIADDLGPEWIDLINAAGPSDPMLYSARDAFVWIKARGADQTSALGIPGLLDTARTVLRGRMLSNEARLALRSIDDLQLVVPGADAFDLYETYGFPLEITQEIAAEAGVEVDVEGYERAMKEAQERSRGGQERENVYGAVQIFELIIEVEDAEEPAPTQTVFVGYDQTRAQTEIVGALPGAMTEPPPNSPLVAHESSRQVEGFPNLVLALKETPFYAESGGQVADTGTIAGSGFEGRVIDVIKQNGVWVHEVEVLRMPANKAAAGRGRGEGKGSGGGVQGSEATEALKPIEKLQATLFRLKVEAEIDEGRRARIVRNHTATHLLHAALRQTLGKHVTQAGSYVGPDRLRFDFTHGKALSEQELRDVERIVNEQVWQNTTVTIYSDLAIADAKAKGAMALFGEKYGDRVRMVEIGDFSRELCGGIHVGHTGEIGLFKIVHESSAAGGVRRIEALTGEGAYEWLLDFVDGLHQAASKLKLPPKSGVRELVHGIDKLHEAQRELKQRLEKARTQGAAGGAANVQSVGSVELVADALRDSDAKDASALADSLSAGQPNRVVLVGSTNEGKITFVCKVGAEAQAKGAHAGNLVREIAKIAGGGGGGRPDFATAGGKDVSKLDEALGAAGKLLGETLNPG